MLSLSGTTKIASNTMRTVTPRAVSLGIGLEGSDKEEFASRAGEPPLSY